MKIEVEISQNRRVGENLWAPGLIGLIISQDTDTSPINPDIPVDISIFVDLTAEQARDLAVQLNHNAELVEKGETHRG